MSVCTDNTKKMDGDTAKRRSAFMRTAQAYVDEFVGAVSEDQLKAAEGNAKARLKHADMLNQLLVSDIMRVGELRGYADGVIQEQIKGWKDTLPRFTGGSEVTPRTVQQGPKRAMMLLKRVDTIVKRRDGAIAKALRTGKEDINLLERALGRPDVVMFMWDKSGIAQKLVRKAMNLGDVQKQHFFNIIDPITKTSKKYIKNIASYIDSGDLTLANMGLGPLTIVPKEGDAINIVDSREVAGRPEYLTDTGEWLTAEEADMDKHIFKERLIEMANNKFTSEYIEGQIREVHFRKVHDFDNEFAGESSDDPQSEYFRLVQVLKQNSKKNYITIKGKTYLYAMMPRMEKDSYGNGHITYTGYIIAERVKKGEWKNLISSGNANVPVPDVTWVRSDSIQYIPTNDGNQYTVYNKFKPVEAPNDLLMVDSGFYAVINATVKQLKTFALMMENRNADSENKLNIIYKNIEAYMKTQNKDVTKEEIDEYINETLFIGDVTERIYRDHNGVIRTNNSNFRTNQSGTYFPRIYGTRELQEMLDEEIENAQARYDGLIATDMTGKSEAQIKNHEDAVKALEKNNANLLKIRNYNKKEDNGNDSKEEINAVIQGRQISSFKGRVTWTNPLRRRKDAAVLSDYFERSLRQLHNNDLVVDLLDSKHRMTVAGINKNVIDYAELKVRQQVGDANTRGLFGKEKDIGNYKWVAGMLNKLPNKFRGGQTYNADSARKLVLGAGGFVSMKLLGMKGALGNNTQLVNDYIRYGIKPVHRAWKDINGDDKELWDERLSKMGVENMLSAMEHFMLADGVNSPTDYAYIPGTGIPSMNMVNWAKLLKASKKDFINGNVDKESLKKMDALLAGIQKKYHGTKKSDIRYMRKLLYDVMTIEKGKTEAENLEKRKLTEDRLKALMGNLAEDRLKAMVTWKLSWWFDGLPGKELFTFTGGEKHMRKVTALAAIYDAIDRGVLSSETVSPEDLAKSESLYVTPLAIEIGRRAVYATMFGMSEVHLGEAFTGVYKVLNQYKGYQTQQTQFEWDTMRGFFGGNDGAGDGFLRLAKTQAQILEHVIKNAFNADSAMKSFAADENIDHDAVIMLRLMWTRFLMSGLSTFIAFIPFANTIMRKVGPLNFGQTMIRSGESPILSLVIKSTAFAAMFALGYDDDDDEYESISENAKNGLLMFSTPALLGMLYRSVTDTAEWFATED